MRASCGDSDVGAGTKAFVDKQEGRIHGGLVCVDRMLFRGGLPMMSACCAKQSGLAIYDKAGLALRVETVIDNPEQFRVRKEVLREGKPRAEGVRCDRASPSR